MDSKSHVKSARVKEEGQDDDDKLFDVAEVSLHNTVNDCWIIIHNNVYDVTNYLNIHPGGIPLILKCAGSDATIDFEAMYHSSRARGVLHSLKIGKLDEKSIQKNSSRLLTPYANLSNQPVIKQGSGPYGLGKYDPKNPMDRMGSVGVKKVNQVISRPQIDQVAWRRYVLLKVEKLNENTSIFRFEVSRGERLGVGIGKHLQVGFNFEGRMQKRDYSPISDEPGFFELLVKKYPHGPGSNHLHNLSIGDGCLMRGLFGSLDTKIEPSKFHTLFCFAAGTGLAPFIPLLKYFTEYYKSMTSNSIPENSNSNTSQSHSNNSITFSSLPSSSMPPPTKSSNSSSSRHLPKLCDSLVLYFCNRKIEDFIMKDFLDQCVLQCHGKLVIEYAMTSINHHQSDNHLDRAMEVDGEVNQSLVEKDIIPSFVHHFGHISELHLRSIFNKHLEAFNEDTVASGPRDGANTGQRLDGTSGATLALLCGPDGFVEATKTLLSSEIFKFKEKHIFVF